MVKLRTLLITLLLLSNSFTVKADCKPVTEVYENIGVVSSDKYLNIRSSASKDSTVVGLLPAGGVFETLREGDSWVWIKSGNVRGYVQKEYVLLGEEGIREAESVSTNKLKIKNATPIYNDLSKSKIWEYASTGTIYDVINDLGNFYEVDLDGTSAFIENTDSVFNYMGLPEATNTCSVTGVSEDRKKLVKEAMKYLGNRYVWGGNDPNTGADCSGYVKYLYKKVLGIDLPRVSYQQCYSGIGIQSLEMQPGDLIFYANGFGRVEHVAMYIGNGTIIHAASSKSGIKLSQWNYRTPVAIRRVINE